MQLEARAKRHTSLLQSNALPTELSRLTDNFHVSFIMIFYQLLKIQTNKTIDKKCYLNF